MSGITDKDLLKITEEAARHLDGLEQAGERKRQAFVDWVTTSPRHVEEALRMAELNTTLTTLLKKKSQSLKRPKPAKAPTATRNPEPGPGDLRTIRRYPNRRLYDTAESRYITLSDVWRMVVECIQFVVIDIKSGEDITRSLLLQLIVEQEHHNPMMSRDFLMQIIRSYGAMTQGMIGSYLEQSLKLFAGNQRNVPEQRDHNPVSPDLVAQKNFLRWRQVQDEIYRTLTNAGKTEQDRSNADTESVSRMGEVVVGRRE